MSIAVFGAGCFWCVEAVFTQLSGVHEVISGYTGGSTLNPTYESICTGTTGHAEVCRITFDPEIISYERLLKVLFTTHDPTTLNQQGSDKGTQYRSAIFFNSPEQKSVAQDMIAALDKVGTWTGNIVTEVNPLDTFYIAEDYHQEYYQKNISQPYCQVVISPKIMKLNEYYKGRLITVV